MEETRTLDIEPLWTDLAPLFCEWLENGTDEQKALARSEIQKMAVAAAHLRAQQKAEEAEIEADRQQMQAEIDAERAYDGQRELAAEMCYDDRYDDRSGPNMEW